MSDYSEEEFEASGTGTSNNFNTNNQFNAKPPVANINNRGTYGLSKPDTNQAAAPFRGNADAFKLDDDDDDDGYAPGGQGVTSGDGEDYEDDDFDEEEEEQFKKTAVEFAKKLSAIHQSTNYVEMVEGGEEPNPIRGGQSNASRGSRPQEETKKTAGRSLGRNQNQSYNNQQANNGGQAAMSPPQKGTKLNRNTQRDITDESLKSPTMLKTTMDKQGKGSRLRQSPGQDAQSMMGGAGSGERTNPFRFIEAALNEAKSKIEKMKNTPQILESLPDDEKKKKFLKAENKLLRENLKRMSDNVNVLIEKMNQESLKKRKGPGAGGAGRGGAGVGGGSVAGDMSAQGDAINGNMTIDEHGRPVQGGVGAGLVPGNLPNSLNKAGGGAMSTAGMSNNRKVSPSGRGGSINRGGVTVAEREIQNTDKAIVNLMKEHNKLKKRLEMIQQPDFLLNLKRDLKTTQEEIKQQEKLKRQLKVDQLRREKKLDNLIEQSEPDVLKQVQDTTQRLAYLTEKLAKLEEENKKAEELRNQQIDQLEELRNRLAKLNTIAEHYGVSVEKSKENMAEHKKLTEQLEHLNKQKRILTQAIDTQTRKQEALTAEKKRDLEQLQMRKGEILAKYNERVVELREKGLQIRDLIERAKTEADDGLQDILNKWQEANERILEKYPEGSQMSFAQLEEAARQSIEVDQDDDQAGKNVRDKKGSVNRAADKSKTGGAGRGKTGVPPRDDEMQIYLSEIRQKQESLIQRLRQDSMAAQAMTEAAQEESAQEQEESKQDASSVSAKSLKSKRKLVDPKKQAIVEESREGAVSEAAVSQQDELAALRAELEREKAEKAQLAQEMADQKATQEAEEKRKQQEAAAKAEEEKAKQQQQVEGGEQVMAHQKVYQPTVQAKPSQLQQLRQAVEENVNEANDVRVSTNYKPVAAPVAAPVTAPVSAPISVPIQKPSAPDMVAPVDPVAQDTAGAASAKPNLMTLKPKLGAYSKPTLGVRNSLAQSSKGAEPQTSDPATKEEVSDAKPLSFLDRARIARQGGVSASVAAPSMVSNPAKDLENIQKENEMARKASMDRIEKTNEPVAERKQPDSSMRYNPSVRESTVGNELPMKLASVGNVGQSMQSGYQPSSLQAPKSNLNPDSGSNMNLGRRRRGGDSPKAEEPLTLEKRVVNDPFANVSYKLSNAGGGVTASQAPAKPLTYEQKLNQESASQPSFLDMIGGGSQANNKAAAPSQISRPQPMMMQASASRVAPSQVNASIASVVPSQISSKPAPAKTNLIADLDDLEDLDL